MSNPNSNPSTMTTSELATLPSQQLVESDEKATPFLFVINSQFGYLQLCFSTKKTVALIVGAVLLVIGNFKPQLFDLLWTLLF